MSAKGIADSHTLSLIDWAALAPGLKSKQDWKDWASGKKEPDIHTPFKPDLPQVPAMHRRRLSPMGKSALWCCHQILQDYSQPHASIFCSQHGEVCHTVSLLKELAKDEPLSPTAFSLSVHNAIAGIHSISNGVTGNITALAAGPDGHLEALLEAYALLEQDSNLEHILCVVYDSPLPDIYQGSTAQFPEFPIALAMLLGRTSKIAPSLTVSLKPSEISFAQEPSETPENMLLQFLSFIASPETTTLLTYADHRTWQCNKSVV